MIAPHGNSTITLRPVSRLMKHAMECSRDTFADVVEISLPDDWPQFPAAFSSETPSHPAPWTGYLFMRTSDGTLLGSGGFVAPPDRAGVVEIGYEIAAAYRNQGYATAAAHLLIDSAFAHGAKAVIAHALGNWNASNAVLQKLGMRFVEERSHSELGLIWRWRIDHPKGAGSARSAALAPAAQTYSIAVR